MVIRNCDFCEHFRAEEVGDSDYGAVYSSELTCSKYLDTDPETETEDLIPNFDRKVERSCCSLEFWKVLEVDKELDKKSHDFNEAYDFFKAKYPTPVTN